MKIPGYSPALEGNEKEYVIDCIESNWISSKGKYIGLLESKFSQYTGIEYALTVSNGSVALQLALAALDIPSGTHVMLPSFGYVAAASAIVRHGCIPLFVDIEANTLQMCKKDVEKKLTSRVSCIIGIHNYGYCYNSKEINELCLSHGIYHIEDCAEAIGTKNIDMTHVGRYSNMSTFSLYGNKTITSGEGGLVCTSQRKLYEKAASLRNHAIVAPGVYEHDDYGFNFRMSNIAAAIAYAQLEMIEEKLERKKLIAKFYQQEVTRKGLSMHDPDPSNNCHSYWMNTVLTDGPELSKQLRRFLGWKGIETRPLFSPIHQMKPYRLFKSTGMAVTNAIKGCGFNLPSHPTLTESELKYIGMTFDEFERTSK